VLGRRKIYLIDEAHMLSKAAFNAFLKILEEPPLSVVFFLATTEPTKIIDTVRSRCFQLFFSAVSHSEIVSHLEHICAQENIKYENDALQIIAEQTDGSVRDAITLLERLRLGYHAITSSNVREALGMPEDRWFSDLVQAIVHGNDIMVRSLLQSYAIHNVTAFFTVWKKIVSLLLSHLDELMRQGNRDQITHCINLLDICYHAETMFSKTQAPALMFEIFVFKLTSVRQSYGTKSSVPEKIDPAQVITNISVKKTDAVTSAWHEVVQKVTALQEPLLSSLFKQAQFMGINEHGVVTLKFGAHYTFFKDVLDSTITQWLPIMQESFKRDVTCVPVFEGSIASEKKVVVNPAQNTLQSPDLAVKKISQSAAKNPRVSVAVPQTERVQTLLKTFPGIVTEIKDGDYD
jgi:DNA polymerase III gamma/tau subunit